jgi:hypothetical protein
VNSRRTRLVRSNSVNIGKSHPDSPLRSNWL